MFVLDAEQEHKLRRKGALVLFLSVPVQIPEKHAENIMQPQTGWLFL